MAVERIKKNKQKVVKKSLRKGHFKRKKENPNKVSKVFTYDLPSRKTFEVSHCSLAFLVVLAFASIIVLILDVWLFAIPVLSTTNFRNTICRVNGYEFVGFEKCECGGITNASPYCKSRFPCVHIAVEYNIHTVAASNSTQRSIIYQDEAVLYNTNYNCSFATCKESRQQNTIELDTFKNSFGTKGSIYPCLYNRDNTTEVIVTRRYGFSVLVLSLALPSLTLLVSIFLFFIVCKTTVHTKVKQLRIRSNRSYIKSGVKLADGTRTTAADAAPASNPQHQLPLPTAQEEAEVRAIPRQTADRSHIILEGKKKKKWSNVFPRSQM